MSTAEKHSLEDVMVAMDVVDTLRHRQELVENELNADDRREQLITKLRDIYQAQGIDVTDAILAEGVSALEEDRFSYQPAKGPSIWLAKLYVSRGCWLMPVLLVLGLCIAFFVVRYFLFSYPQAQLLEALPGQIGTTFNSIQKTAKDPSVVSDAKDIINRAAEAIDERDAKSAEDYHQQLVNIKTLLLQSYQIRIVSRIGEQSGIWRIPDANPNAKNYYLIVEAIDRNGKVVSTPITSEENNQRTNVSQWGLRVNRATFNRVAADKKDDGIIQNNIVGRKDVGFIKPNYTINTTGATITDY